METSAIQNVWCGFLFAFYSDYGAILYHVPDIAILIGRNSRNFYTPPVFSAPEVVTPSEFREGV